MELSDAAAYTAIAGVVFTFLVMVASVIYRIGRLTQSVDDVKSTMLLYKESLQEQMEYHRTTLALQMQSLEERMNHNHEILRSDIQRLFERDGLPYPRYRRKHHIPGAAVRSPSRTRKRPSRLAPIFPD